MMEPPITAEQLAELAGFSTPTLCNAIETLSTRSRIEGFTGPTIVSRMPELGPVAGYAVTLKIRARVRPERALPHREIWRRFDEVPRPWVVVVEDLDYPRCIGSYWGEVNASVYQALGAVAAVTNGGVRDLAEVRATGFRFFSSCLLVSHAHVHAVDAGMPVRVGGLDVRTGDLLHADEHGVLSIPAAVAPQLAAAARAIETAEQGLIRYARSGAINIERLAELYGHLD